MNTMSHKGYTARVEFDDRDNIFVGRDTTCSRRFSFFWLDNDTIIERT